MTGRSVLTLYLVTLALMLMVGLWRYYSGDSGNMIFMKILFCGVYLLAGRGLESIFPPENAPSRHWLVQLEMYILEALLLATFLLFTISDLGTSTFPQQLAMMVTFTAIYAPLKLLFSGGAAARTRQFTGTLLHCNPAFP